MRIETKPTGMQVVLSQIALICSLLAMSGCDGRGEANNNKSLFCQFPYAQELSFCLPPPSFDIVHWIIVEDTSASTQCKQARKEYTRAFNEVIGPEMLHKSAEQIITVCELTARYSDEKCETISFKKFNSATMDSYQYQKKQKADIQKLQNHVKKLESKIQKDGSGIFSTTKTAEERFKITAGKRARKILFFLSDFVEQTAWMDFLTDKKEGGLKASNFDGIIKMLSGMGFSVNLTGVDVYAFGIGHFPCENFPYPNDERVRLIERFWEFYFGKAGANLKLMQKTTPASLDFGL